MKNIYNDGEMAKHVRKLPKWAQEYIGWLILHRDRAVSERVEAFEKQGRASPVWWEVGRVGPGEGHKRYIPGAPEGEDLSKWPHGEYIRVHFLDKNGAEWEVGFDREGDLNVRGVTPSFNYGVGLDGMESRLISIE